MAESRLHKIIYLAIVLMLLALAVPFFVPSVQAATVVTLLPNEAGDETVLTTSPEATTNWECVKVNDGDGSYVFSGSGTVQRDLYRLADTSLSGTINSVTVHGICKGTKPGDGARFSIKINGTVYDGTEISVALEYAEFSSQWTTNPSGGNWSWEDINALQAGVGLKKPTGGAEARCTQLRVVVDYSADVTAPTGTLSVVTDPIYEGDLVQVVTVTYDEQMNTGSTPTISFSGATGAINTESDGAWSGGDTWTETFTVIDADEETATVTVSSLEATDVVGNPEGSCVTDTFAIDTAALTIVSITSGATAAGVLKVGDTITFTLTPDATEAGATVSGSYNSVDLTWSTTDGGVTYTTTYTISESDTDQTSALQITGVTITDAAGNVSATASGSDVAKTIDSERKCKCTNYDIKFVKVTYDTDTNKSKFTYEVIEYGDPGISHFTLVLSGEAYDYVSSNLRDDNEYYELVSPDPNTGAGGLKRDEVEIVRYEGSGRETYSFTLDGKWTGASSIVAGEAVVKAGSDCICTLRVNVPVCPVPVARDNTHVIDEDTGISIEVLDNDDLGDKPTTITEVTQGENGGVSSTETTTTYTPNPDFNGTDSYTYTITDSNNETDTAIVTITITPINDAPVAVADAYSTNEDTTLNVSAAGVLNNDSDVDGDGLGSSVLSGPSNGTLTLDGDGSFTYTPNENFNGADSFTYSANDGNGGSDQATVTITVNDVNDVPVANNDSTSTPEDIAVDINVVANDTDVDGTIDATTVTVISAATNGSVSIDTTTGLVTYTPNADYNGPDSLTYTVNDDDNSTSNEATITITVTAVNDVPVVSDIPGQTVNEDTLFATISLDDYVTDVDNTDAGMSWSYSGNTNLTVSITDHVATITYPTGWNRSETITFTATDPDGLYAEDPATFTVNNLAPMTNAQSVATDEDTPLRITLTGSDPGSDPLTYSIVSGPSHGTLTGTAPNLTYAPDLNYNGPDSFEFKANDGDDDSTNATVTITVDPVNDVPVVSDIPGQTVNEDTLFATISLDDYVTDVDNTDAGMSWSYSGNTNLTVSITDHVATITYPTGWNRSETITFTATDPDGLYAEDPATFTVNNLAPMTNAQSVATDEDTPLRITLTGSDPGSDPLTYSIVSGPSHGTLTGTAPNLTYAPDLNYNGPDSFEFKANDGDDDSTNATVTITVDPVNDVPVVSDIPGQTVNEDTLFATISLDDYVTDVDNTDAGMSWSYSGNTNLTVSITDHVATITYPTGWNRSETITFTATDPDGLYAEDPATFTVNNLAPMTNAQSVATDEDTPLRITLTGSDPGSDPLTYSIVSGPSHGTLTGTAPNLTYAPDLNYNGPDSFEFKANDGDDDSTNATVTITVDPVNDVPVAVDDAAEVNEDSGANTIDVVANDIIAPDTGETLTITAVTQPTNGTVVITGDGADLTYAPADDYFGSDTFSYTISDGNGGTDTATVTVTITEVNDAPTTSGIDDQVNNDSDSVSLDISGSFDDVDTNDMLTFAATALPEGLSIDGIGLISGTITNNASQASPYLVMITATDEQGVSVDADFTWTVNNPAPTAQDDTATTDRNIPVVVDVLANDSDVDGDTLSVDSVTQPANGVVTNNNSDVIYTPNAEFTGMDTFTYTVSDRDGGTDTATVTVEVLVGGGGGEGEGAVMTAMITSPENGLVTEESGRIVTYELLGENLSIGIFFHNGEETSIEAESGSITITLMPGDNILQVRATNDAGATASSEQVTVTFVPREAEAPVLAAIGDKVVNELSRLTFSISATDPDVPANTLTYSATGLPAGATFIDGTFAWTPTEVQGPGTYAVTFGVSDGALTDSETITITVNEVILEITITNPPPMAFAGEGGTFVVSVVEVEGVVVSYPAVTKVTIILNDKHTMIADVDDGYFAYTVTALEEGLNTIRAEVTDTWGETASSGTVGVVYVPEKLIVEVLSPQDGELTNAEISVVSGTITHGRAVITTTLYLNGAANEVALILESDEGGKYSYSFSETITLREGENTFAVEGIDEIGNSSSSGTMSVILDTTPPRVEITTPGSNYLTNTTTVLVTGTVNDPAVTEVTVEVNGTGQTMTVVEGSFSGEVILIEGTNTIRTLALDPLGNEGSSQPVVVTYNSAAPTVSITSPAGGTRTNSDTITVNYTIAGNPTSAQFILNGVSEGILPETGSTTVSLAEGENTIEVQARNVITTASSGVVTVVSDTTPPSMSVDVSEPWEEVVVTVYADEELSSPPIVTITGTDTTNVDMALTGVREWSGTYEIPEDGDYTVEAVGTDEAGNTSSSISSFSREKETVSAFAGETITVESNRLTVDIKVDEEVNDQSISTVVRYEDPRLGRVTEPAIFVRVKTGVPLRWAMRAMTVKAIYDPTILPADVSESSLLLYLWTPSKGGYVPVEGATVNTIEHSITGTVTY